MENQNNKKKIIGISIGVCAFVLAVLAIVFCYINIWGNPKRQLVKSLTMLVKDAGAYSENIIDEAQLEQLLNSVNTGNSKIDYTLNVSGIKIIKTTIGVDGELQRNFEKRQLSSKNFISVMNMKLLDVDVHFNNNRMYVNIPQLFDSTFSVNTTTLADDFNKSAFTQLLGLELPADLNFDIWRATTNKEIKLTSNEDMMNRLKELYSQDFNSLIKELEVNKDKAKQDFTLESGDTLELTIYNVIIPKEQLNAVINDIATDAELNVDSSFGINVNEDVQLYFGIDKDKQIRKICTQDDIVLASNDNNIEKIGIEWSFCVEEIETDKQIIDSNVRLTNSDMHITAQTEYQKDGDTNVDVDVDVSGEVNTKSEFKGSFSYDEEACALNTDIQKFNCAVDNEDIFRITGNVCVAEEANEVIDIPSVKIVDVMDMNIMDLIGLAGELEHNSNTFKQIMDTFGGF